MTRVVELYRQLPFGQMDQWNAEVQRLASELDRTPSAVALKLVNFASLDPQLSRRGIRGMANASKQDRAIWDELKLNLTANVSRGTSVNQSKNRRKTPRSIRIESNLRCQRIYPVEGSKKSVGDLKTIGINLNREQAINLARAILAVTQDSGELDITAYRFEKRKSDDSYMLTVTYR